MSLGLRAIHCYIGRRSDIQLGVGEDESWAGKGSRDDVCSKAVHLHHTPCGHFVTEIGGHDLKDGAKFFSFSRDFVCLARLCLHFLCSCLIVLVIMTSMSLYVFLSFQCQVPQDTKTSDSYDQSSNWPESCEGCYKPGQ